MLPDVDDLWRRETRKTFADLYAPMTATEWCREHYRLSPEVTSVEGRFEPVPYQRGLLDICCMDGGPEVVCLLKASRIGYSATLVGATMFLLARVKRHVLIYMPNDGEAKSFGKDTLGPALRDCEVTASMLDDLGPADKRSGDTMQYRVLGGKTLRVVGAQSKARFKRVSADAVILDETDSYPGDVQGEGSPVALAHRAIVNSPFRRQLIGGKPGDESISIVWREYQSCPLRMTYHVLCPHCSALTPMEWDHFHWPEPDGSGTDIDRRAESVEYACPSCGSLWSNNQLPLALAGGAWVSPASGDSDNPNPYEGWMVETAKDGPPMLVDEHGKPQDWPHRLGLYVWAGHSPLSNWSRMVRDFLNAQGDIVKLKAFTNEIRGLPWRDVATKLERNQLHAQRKPMLPLPSRFTRITGAVDIQDGWLSVLVCAWAEGEECALVERREFHGAIDTVNAPGWTDLKEWLSSNPAWEVEGVGHLAMSALAIDTSWMTDIAYRMIRRLPHHRIYAIKGSSDAKAPVIKRPPSRIRSGENLRLPLFSIGTHQAKQILVGRMAGVVKGAAVHYHSDLPEEVYDELAAEELVTRRERGTAKRVWIKIRDRNEALDCLVYNLASIRLLSPSNWSGPERRAVVASPAVKPKADAPKPVVRQPRKMIDLSVGSRRRRY